MKLSSERLMQAFAPVPPEFESSVEIGFRRGELAMRRRHRFTATLSAAAVFVVLLAVAALAAGSLGRPRPDNVVLSGGSAAQATPMPTAFRGNGLPRQTASGVTPLPTASASIEPVSLEQRLTNVLTACIEEGGAQIDANTKTKRVDKAVHILMAVPEKYGADVSQWLAPIRECLLRELELSEDTIAERELVNLLVSYLRCAEQTPSPEDTATPMPTEENFGAYMVSTSESVPTPEIVYLWNEPVELPYGVEAETASVSYSVDAPVEFFEASCEENAAEAAECPMELAVEPADEGDAYERLLAHRTEDYLNESVAEFNRALLEEGGLEELLEAYEEVMDAISPDDENYDFFALTLDASVNELYCEAVGEEVSHPGSAERLADETWEPLPGVEWIWSDERAGNLVFYCIYTVNYAIDDPSALTVAERDGVLEAFDEGLQDYVDGLSEQELVSGNVRTGALTEWAEVLAERLSTDDMRLFFTMNSVACANSATSQSVRVQTASAPGADSLRQLLEVVLMDFDDGSDVEEQNRRLENTLASLLSIRDDAGADRHASVWECLVDEMGLTEDFIVENDIVDQVIGALYGGGGEEANVAIQAMNLEETEAPLNEAG